MRQKRLRSNTYLLGIIFLVFISLGLPDSVFGVAWPAIHTDLSVPLEFASFCTITIMLLAMCSSLANPWVIRHMKTGAITAVSCVLTALGLIGTAYSKSFWFLLLCCIPLGIGAGTVDTTVNNHVSKYYTSKHMNWLHGFWGVGATMGPLIYSLFMMQGMGWRSGMGIIGLIQMFFAVILLLNIQNWKTGDPVLTETAQKEPTVQKVEHINHKGYLRVLFFFLLCGLECSIGLWSSSVLVYSRGISAESVGIWISCYYGAITVGRLLIGFVSNKLGTNRLIKLGLVIALAGAVFMLFPSVPAFAFLGLMLLGLGQSPMYPSLMHDTHHVYEEKTANRIVSFQVSSAILGNLVTQATMGWVIAHVGYEWLYYIAFGLVSLMSLLFFYIAWNPKKGKIET